MKISIITINRNNLSGLQKTIDSVISQTYRDFEWIIIDGGSTDGSCELIKRYEKRLSYWCSEPDRGIYDGMNKGIRVSHGDYLLFLNSGDYLYDKHVLQNVVPLLAGNDFYIGREQRNDYHYIWDESLSTTGDICRIFSFFFVPHQSSFIFRGVFDKYGYYREDVQLSSDWYMFYKATILGNATVTRIPYLITVFAGNGISHFRQDIVKAEHDKLLSELPRVKYLSDFYHVNCDIIRALKSSRIIFFLFRLYYRIYRTFSKS